MILVSSATSIEETGCIGIDKENNLLFDVVIELIEEDAIILESLLMVVVELALVILLTLYYYYYCYCLY